MSDFTTLGVPEVLARSLAEQGITTPFPVQAATLPDSLAGRDVLGRGRTGSGKTLAFALPLVARLAAGRTPRLPGRPRGLVLAPTRELATQIAATVEPLAAAAGLTVTTIFGGVPQRRQEIALAAGVDVVVACPGRLEDLLGQRVLTLAGVEVTVLDEADHMADLGFLPGVRRLLGATPSGGQRMLFSATLDNGVDELVRRFLDKPVRHSVDPDTSAVQTMTHHVLTVETAEAKRDVVQHLASGTTRRVLFTRTKHQARTLARRLTTAGIPAVDLHGNLSQNARQRNLEAFSSGEVRVLVATDIAARGIHVDDVALVVHVDPPAEHKAYLHRSGRTARAGSGGDVVTLVLPEQAADMRALARLARIDARPTPVVAGDGRLTALVGAPAPVVRHVPTQAPARTGTRAAGATAPGRGRGGAAGAGPTGTAGSGTAGDDRPRRRRGRGRGGAGASSAAGASGAGSRASGAARGGEPARTGGAGHQARSGGSRGATASGPAATGGRSAAVELSMRGTRSRRGR